MDENNIDVSGTELVDPVPYFEYSTPRKVGAYNVLEEIGKGGMGVVFKGHDPLLDRSVAIKMLSPKIFINMDHQLRFIQEAKIIAKLSHPGIVKIYSIEYVEGNAYLIMEYLEGDSLTSLLRKEGKLSMERALNILQQLAAALSYAHSKGIIHLDVKPSNIHILSDGRVKLMDFGISLDKFSDLKNLKIKVASSASGTPRYMSPEQFLQRAVDHRSDIYSFGAMAYLLLTGKHLFEGRSRVELSQKHVNQEPIPIEKWAPECPERIRIFIHSCLEKDKKDRPPTLFGVRFKLESPMTEKINNFLDWYKKDKNKKFFWIGSISFFVVIMILIISFTLFFSQTEPQDHFKKMITIPRKIEDVKSKKDIKKTEDMSDSVKIKSEKSLKVLTKAVETTLKDEKKIETIPQKTVTQYPFLDKNEEREIIRQTPFPSLINALSSSNKRISKLQSSIQKLLWVDKNNLTQIIHLLKSKDKELVKNVAYILGLRNSVDAVSAIIDRINNEHDEILLSELYKSLGYINDERVETYLNDVLINCSSFPLFRAILSGLYGRATSHAIEKSKLLLLMLSDPDKDFEKTMLKAEIYLFLARNNDISGETFAFNSIKDSHEELKIICLEIFSAIKKESGFKYIKGFKRVFYKSVNLFNNFIKAKAVFSSIHLKDKQKFDMMEKACQKNNAALSWLPLYILQNFTESEEAKKWVASYFDRYSLKEYKDYIRAFYLFSTFK